MTTFETHHDDLRMDAIRGFLACIGGIAGMVARDIPLVKLNLIRDADLSDPGIRFNIEVFARLASSSKDTQFDDKRTINEPLLSPEVAKRWLLHSQRAVETANGLVLNEGDGAVHLSLAGLAIAQSAEPRLLSEAYADISTAQIPIPTDIIAQMGVMIVNDFTDQEL